MRTAATRTVLVANVMRFIMPVTHFVIDGRRLRHFCGNVETGDEMLAGGKSS